MNLKLKNGFTSMGDPQLQTRAIQILGAMTGNEFFPTPLPSVPDMEEISSEFMMALVHCQSGDRHKIAIKNAKRKLLIQSLHKWSLYVILESDDNEAKAITSGFDISPARSPRLPLTKPSALVITNGINNGELVFKGKRVANAISYIFEYATLEGMTTNQWSRLSSTTIKLVVTSLNRGVLYYCRIGAIGSNKQLVFSDITSRTAA